MRKGKATWLRVQVGGQERLLECEAIKADSISLNVKPLCRCCSQELIAIADFIQWGYYEDRYITVFTCEACGKAFWYRYHIPIYNLAVEGGDSKNDR